MLQVAQWLRTGGCSQQKYLQGPCSCTHERSLQLKEKKKERKNIQRWENFCCLGYRHRPGDQSKQGNTTNKILKNILYVIKQVQEGVGKLLRLGIVFGSAQRVAQLASKQGGLLERYLNGCLKQCAYSMTSLFVKIDYFK